MIISRTLSIVSHQSHSRVAAGQVGNQKLFGSARLRGSIRAQKSWSLWSELQPIQGLCGPMGSSPTAEESASQTTPGPLGARRSPLLSLRRKGRADIWPGCALWTFGGSPLLHTALATFFLASGAAAGFLCCKALRTGRNLSLGKQKASTLTPKPETMNFTAVRRLVPTVSRLSATVAVVPRASIPSSTTASRSWGLATQTSRRSFSARPARESKQPPIHKP